MPRLREDEMQRPAFFAAFSLKSHRGSTARGRLEPAIAVLVALWLAGVATAQVTSLYYREVPRDGRIYVFNTPERYKAFTATGEMGTAITLIGRGPHGETVVAENETAVDLFLFKHDLPAYDRPSPKPAAPATPTPPIHPQAKVGGTAYLAYQNGTAAGVGYSRFVVKRAYINVDARLASFLAARITPDVSQDPLTGQYTYRLKYAYGVFSTPEIGFITGPYVEFGMVHTPWIDFEEKVDNYRMQDTLFFERVGLAYSSDLGVMVGGLFGSEMPEDYQKTVSSAYPGRYGSFAIGAYNGGGYAAAERNTNKGIEWRLTIRPLPDVAPGLQLSYFGIVGDGNTPAAPHVTLNSGSLTFESRYANAVATYVKGTGNLAGTAIGSGGEPLPYQGWSGFAEAKLSPRWSVIARWDKFTADTGAADTTNASRVLGGVAFHIGRGNDLLLDYDEISFSSPARPKDTRTQLTLQLKF
jgi:hypothetical protein